MTALYVGYQSRADTGGTNLSCEQLLMGGAEQKIMDTEVAATEPPKQLVEAMLPG